MLDPAITCAIIQSYAAALQGAMSRHAANASRCRVWGGGIVAGMLLLSASTAQVALLPWAAGVVVLLALAEAGQAALARVFTEAWNGFMAKVPLNGGPSTKAQADGSECFILPEPLLGWRQAGLVLRALGSFSVWPFHGALLALLAMFYLHPPQFPHAAQPDARTGEASAVYPNHSVTTTRTFTPASAGSAQPGISGQPGTVFQPGNPGPQPAGGRTAFPGGNSGQPGGLAPGSTPPLKFPSTKVSVPISPNRGPSGPTGPNRTAIPGQPSPSVPSSAPGTPSAAETASPTRIGTPIPGTKPTPPQPGARPTTGPAARPQPANGSTQPFIPGTPPANPTTPPPGTPPANVPVPPPVPPAPPVQP